MKPLPILAPVALILAATFLVISDETPPAGQVEVAVLDEPTWNAFAPQGKEVDAIYGDLVLRNGQLAAVIAAPLATRHANLTVKDIGGALIDLTTRSDNADQLLALYPGGRGIPFRTWAVLDQEGREIPLAGSYKGRAAAVVMRASGEEGKPEVKATYRLEQESPVLTLETTYKNTGTAPITVKLEDELRFGSGKEDLDTAPNGTADVYWTEDRYWGQAYAIQGSERKIQFNAAPTTSLRYIDKDQKSVATLAPGESVRLVRTLSAGKTAWDARAPLTPAAEVPVPFAVVDGAGQPVGGARLEIRQKEAALGSVQVDASGRAKLMLEPGEYVGRAKVHGTAITDETKFTVTAGAMEKMRPVTVALASYRPGIVLARITDADGGKIPCKVEFVGDGHPNPDFGPETAEFAVKNLRYTPDGTFQQPLAPGRYKVIVSHGPEFDALFQDLEVRPGETSVVSGSLVRSVSTPGWISSDFHSHSSPSGDNTSSQLGRVLNLVCEHLEFAPCTEHARVATYQPHIDSLGIGQFLSSVEGIELTGSPLPLNHHNAFPLHHHPHRQNGGGPTADADPQTQIERLALWDNRSEKLVQQNHPDIGWLFFDKDGDGHHDGGYSRGFAFMDVMEVHPIDTIGVLKEETKEAEKPTHNTIVNWLQLLNQGQKVYGVVNTDAHYNFHGSGGLRNWIQSPTDDPAAIKPLDVVHASEQGRLIMSNGPYLELSCQGEDGKTATAGESLQAKSLTLKVRVQCPNWHDIDRVFVLVNGRIPKGFDFTRATHSDKFETSTVKFDQTLTLPLESDAHVIVVAIGENGVLGPVMGPAWGKQKPTAVSNPVFVDHDGNGFQPNRDTLGYPLPVKYVAPAKK